MADSAPVGRPTDYREAYCEDVIELGKAGKSPAQMASHFDVSRETLNNWGNAHPEFLAATLRAKAHCQAWWEDKGMDGMLIPGFNATVWKKSVEARFREDYTERQEFSGPRGGAIPVAGSFEIVLVPAPLPSLPKPE